MGPQESPRWLCHHPETGMLLPKLCVLSSGSSFILGISGGEGKTVGPQAQGPSSTGMSLGVPSWGPAAALCHAPGPAKSQVEGLSDRSQWPWCQPCHCWQEDARRLPARWARQNAGGCALSKSASLSVIDSFPDADGE